MRCLARVISKLEKSRTQAELFEVPTKNVGMKPKFLIIKMGFWSCKIRPRSQVEKSVQGDGECFLTGTAMGENSDNGLKTLCQITIIVIIDMNLEVFN